MNDETKARIVVLPDDAPATAVIAAWAGKPDPKTIMPASIDKMNCHYCTYPSGDDDPYVAIGTRMEHVKDLRYQQRHAHLACAIANVNTIQGHPDKSGKWCSYYHQPNGKWCMLPPHGDEMKHELEGEGVPMTEELTKERMAELLRQGKTAKDFDMKDGKLYEKAESPNGGNADKRN